MPETDCAPDCDERAECPRVDLGHQMCGRCPTCRTPRHHGCACNPRGEN